MKRSIAARLMLACGLLGGTAALCAAQAYTPPPPPLTTLPPCPTDKDAKKRAKRKDCDPTVYPSETVEKKGKTPDAAANTVAPPTAGAQPAARASAAQAHPYPGDTSADMPSASGAANPPAGAAHPYPGDSGKDLPGDDVPHDPAAEKRAAETPAGKANPFPSGGTPDMPSDAAGPPGKPDDSQSGPPASNSPDPSSSSSSSSSSRDDAAGNPDKNAKSTAAKNPDDDDDVPPKLNDKGSSGRRTMKVVKPQSDTDRVDEDLSVARFYGQSGNFMGAYLRAKDAVKIQPDYPEGHFSLGEAAKRLKKNDEAAAEFQAYLKLAPDGQKAKAAEKALEELK